MMKTRMLIAAALLLVPSLALADAKCVANPKAEWKSEAQARAKFVGEGYKISKFKVSGDCYEIYGFDRNGKKVEIYFDTKTLKVVKQETDD